MIDSYTKIILTIIAVSTSIIALKGSGLIHTATAETEKIQKVAICDIFQPNVCADVSNVGTRENVLFTYDLDNLIQ